MLIKKSKYSRTEKNKTSQKTPQKQNNFFLLKENTGFDIKQITLCMLQTRYLRISKKKWQCPQSAWKKIQALLGVSVDLKSTPPKKTAPKFICTTFKYL